MRVSFLAHNNRPPANIFGQVSSSNIGRVQVVKIPNADPNGELSSIPVRRAIGGRGSTSLGEESSEMLFGVTSHFRARSKK